MKPFFKKGIIFLLIFTSVFALTSCGGTDGTNMSFSYPISSEPSTLDPQVCSDTAVLTVVSNLYEGLVRIGSDGSIIPGAAEKMNVSSDGITYTFKLRSGLKWHLINNFSNLLGDNFKDTFDASLTAHDFVFGLRRALSPKTSSPEAASLYVIKNAQAVHNGKLPVTSLGVMAVDDLTLVITLSSGCIDFLPLLAQPICMPCNETFFNACKGKYGIDLDYTMCNGPFYLSRWTSGSSLLIKTNKDYKGNVNVLPYSVTFYINPDKSGYVKKVADGIYDAAPCHTDSTLPSDSSGCTIYNYNNTVWSLCINCEDDVLSNLYTRLALCNSFDRSQLGFSESLTQAKGILPSCCRIGNENYRNKAGNADFMEFNFEKACDYWKTGLDAIDVSTAKLTVLCTSDYEKPVRKLLQYWQHAFGLSVSATIEIVELSKLERAISSQNYQVALAPITASSSSAAICLTDYSNKSDKNTFGLVSETYVDIVNRIFLTGSSSSAAEGCRTAESFLMQNGAVYPFFEDSEYLVLAENVSGIYACPAGKSVNFISAIKIN